MSYKISVKVILKLFQNRYLGRVVNARSVLSEVSVGENGILTFLGKFCVWQVPPCYVRAWREMLYNLGLTKGENPLSCQL